MKKLICLLLALSMTTLLFACNTTPEEQELDAPPVSTEPSTQAPTEKPTEPTEELHAEPQRVSLENQVDFTPDEPVTANVTDAVNIQYKDKYGKSGSLILPKIELPGPNVESINAEILNDYGDFARSEDDSREMNYSNIYYKWGVHGDILSVFIVGGGSVFDGGWDDYGGCDLYSVYNISISRCRLVSNEEVYAASGMENIKTRVLHAIASYGSQWRGKDADAVENFYSEPDTGWSLECLKEELKDENFEAAVPYFNEDGKLCVMGRVFTFVGRGDFWAMLVLDDYPTDTLGTAEEYYRNYYEKFVG